MVNRPLREAIKAATDVTTDRTIQIWIKNFRRQHLVSSAQAERMIAYLKGVDLEQFVSQEELAETRELLTREGLPVLHIVRRAPAPEKKVLKVSSVEVSDPLLPPSAMEDARRMSEAYAHLYVFENSVRNFIQVTMEQQHGKDWWDEHVGAAVKREVTKRINQEKKNAWHGRRGSHPIHYTDIDGLTKIIKSNDATFMPFFDGLKGGIGWLEIRLGEIELSRNAVAHHRPLRKTDIEGMKRYFEQWQKQLSSWKDLLSD